LPRSKSSEPKRVLKKLHDGTVWAYLYDRETGKNVGKEQVGATGPTPPAAGSFAELAAEYLKSTRFLSRSPGTQSEYRHIIADLVDNWGDRLLKAMTPIDVQWLKDQYSDWPSKANHAMAVASILFNFGVKRGLIASNPAAQHGKLEAPPRTQIWSPEAEERFVAEFRPSLKLAFSLMLYTLQRLSDCLAMTTNQITERDGRLYIVLTQSKTGTLVAVPVHNRLEPLLRERMAQRITRNVKGPDGKVREVETHLLVPSPRGEKWSRRNASRAWDIDIAKSNKKLRAVLIEQGMTEPEIEAELSRHVQQRRDLRRTGVVRLAERGATTAQIAAISGHEIDYCQRIINTYLPRRTEVALGGIEAWERQAPTVVRVPDAAREETRKLRIVK
jgi:integrase